MRNESGLIEANEAHISVSYDALTKCKIKIKKAHLCEPYSKWRSELELNQ